MTSKLKSLTRTAMVALSIMGTTVSAQDLSVGELSLSTSDLETRFETYEIETITTWTGSRIITFTGPRLSDLAAAAGISQNSNIIATAADGYSVEIDLSDILKYQPIVATREGGELIPFEAKGPTRIIWPRSDNPDVFTIAKDGYWIWYLGSLIAAD
jgi:hypothetical protein